MPGFGDAAGESSDFSVAAQADAVAARIARQTVERFVLVGASMGGKIAMALAARRPAGLAGLLLLAPSPPTPEPMTDAGRAALLAGQQDEASAADVVKGAAASALDAATMRQATGDALRTSPAAWRAWVEGGSREDIGGDVTNIDVPTRLLVGGGDAHLGEAAQRRETLPRIGGATLAVVPDVGHLLPLEAPRAVAAAVRALAATGAIWSLMQSSRTTIPTRTVMVNRLRRPAVSEPSFFGEREFATLRAVCARLVPPPEGVSIDVAGAIDGRLAKGDCDGWRYDALPGDGDAYRLGLKLLDELCGGAFAAADADAQDAALLQVQQSRQPLGDLARPDRFFEDLLAEAAEVHFSNPAVQAEMNYVGFADAGGWEVK